MNLQNTKIALTKAEKEKVVSELGQAIKLARQGLHAEALPIFNRYTANLPDDLDARTLFGDLCIKLENVETGIAIFRRLVQDFPDEVTHNANLGWAYIEGHRFDLAEPQLRKAVDEKPDNWSFVSNYSVVLLHLKRYEEAIEYIEKAIALNSGVPGNYENLIIALKSLGRHEEALQVGTKAIRRYPKESKLHSSLGLVRLEMGNEAEAVECFDKAVDLNAMNGDAYLFLASAKKFSTGDMPLVQRVEKALKTGMPPVPRSYIHFALAKIYNDLKEHETAYSHLYKANTLKKVRHHMPPVTHLKDLLATVFTDEFIKSAQSMGSSSERPVFVIGMPRSGTTLIEQVIGRHSKATGVGELENIGLMAQRVSSILDKDKYVKKWNENLNTENLKKFADEYLGVLEELDGSALKMVDKMPDNFLHMGFICLMFPKAKFIHATRDPLDNCLSCYFQCFQSVNWAFDLKSIGERYIFYRDIMELWKQVIPADRILEVKYEELVDNPESGAKRIIEHCGLDWEPQCLDSTVGSKAVSTASLWQVRQPIYKSSVKRWHPYAENLAELAKLIAPFIGEDDIKHFQSLGMKIKKKKWWPF